MSLDFTRLPDLASERMGGRVLSANDEFFAPKENLLKSSRPVFVDGKFTDRGKWMDGWETRRRRSPGHDWCVVALGAPGLLRGVVVDTAHFKGNFPEACSLLACSQAPDDNTHWVELLPKMALAGDSENSFALNSPWRFTHVRLNIFPDGGVARLRIYGDVVPAPQQGPYDLAAAPNGGWITASSDAFFAAPQNLLFPGAATHMGDGWETRRRRGPGHDWVIVRLATAGTIGHVEVDTSHFKGNYPESCQLQSCDGEGVVCEEVLPRVALAPDTVQRFAQELRPHAPAAFVMFRIFPDGGVARLRIFGTPSEAGKTAIGLRWLDSLPPDQAAAAFLRCCASRAWAAQMASSRPFVDRPALHQRASAIWQNLDATDWREAFAGHPQIGASHAQGWAQSEQAGTRDATPALLQALQDGNREYEQRFGHVFLVCATGKTAPHMLALLRQRLDNDPTAELHVAADEQRKITELRLDKLMGGRP